MNTSLEIAPFSMLRSEALEKMIKQMSKDLGWSLDS